MGGRPGAWQRAPGRFFRFQGRRVRLPASAVVLKNMSRRLIVIAFLLLVVSPPVRAAIRWETWDDAVFARAKRERRFVLLDLEAVWCHWCHVMDATTYRDPTVTALIDGKYIALKVDQGSRPDLSTQYG